MDNMNQCIFDKLRFSDLLSKFTGISKMKIDKYLNNNPVNNVIEHPGVLGITAAQIKKIEELKELSNLYKALKLSKDNEYIINSSWKAGEYFKAYFSDIKDKERFVCSFLDSKNKILATKVISYGTVNEAPVYSRNIVKDALLHDACSVILAHNHPGGTCFPSNDDRSVTSKVINALKSVNINCVDHIIAAGDSYYSFAESGAINTLQESKNCQYSISVCENIQNKYKAEYPAIKHIKESTARSINNLNEKYGKVMTIKEIKDLYKAAGKKIELNNDKASLDEFKALKEIVDELKQAQLAMKQEQSLQKSLNSHLNKVKSIELA